MADATYDVVVIGGGTKAIVAALYLQAYGGMNVAIFERRHELGGGWGSHEAPAPGFIGDTHASTIHDWYFETLYRDFPDIEDKGLVRLYYRVPMGVISKEKHESIVFYDYKTDPTAEKSAAQIARFSKRDAETFIKMDEIHYGPGGRREAFLQEIFDLPVIGQPSPLEVWMANYLKRPDRLFDEQMVLMSAFQVGRILFPETPELRAFVLDTLPRAGQHPDMPLGLTNFFVNNTLRERCILKGGTHSAAHACIRIFVEKGGKFFTRQPVRKIIVENGAARGIVLEDGTEVRAKYVICGLDPNSLVDFVGPENLSDRTVLKVRALERDLTCITWYTWAIHELPKYKAADFNPDIQECHWIDLSSKDDTYMIKEASLRRAGLVPPEPQIVVFGQHSLVDPSRAPEGKHVVSTETMLPPAWRLSEREWMKLRKEHTEAKLKKFQEYAPNMTWDNVIGFDAISPYDIAKRDPNFGPAGNWATIDDLPAQLGRYRPIVEWADHRIRPIKNLYAANTGWGPVDWGHSGQGYRCYKAMAIDLGLRKPWEENKGLPW